MFFEYPPGEMKEPPRPKAVFARADQFEALDAPEESSSLVLLDCIEADWLERIDNGNLYLADPDIDDPDHRISIVSIQRRYLMDADKSEEDLSQWYRLEFGEPNNSFPAEQFHNLFQDPVDRSVIEVRPVTGTERSMLSKLAGWHNISGSEPEQIRAVLSRIGMIDTVAIYDVGQGAATALLIHGVPSLYFDIGGSTIFNHRSFPAPLQSFCVSGHPLVVLSHWDWDHWSSALRDPQILSRDWILPIQKNAGDLGAVHARFLAKLKENNANLYWWDYQMQPVTFAQNCVTISRASGSETSRNESGLFLSVAGRRRNVLLPGDASLPNVCPHCSNDHVTVPHCANYDHVMVPHHGGRTLKGYIPGPRNITQSHLIYSYGVGNSYLHPLADTVRSLRGSWKRNTHTPLRDQTGLGHVGIDLHGRTQNPSRSPCFGAMCQLQIRQWI